MSTLNTLDRLRAADPSPADDRPPFDDVLARIEARGVPSGAHAAPSRGPLRLRRALPVGVLATGALAASLVVVIGAPDDGGLPQLGVLEAAAATAEANPDAGRFSGYVEEERLSIDRTSETPAATYRTRTIVRRVSATQYDGTLESTQRALPGGVPEAPQAAGTPPPDDGGARTSRTRRGDEITFSSTWRRSYGTIFTGAVRTGEQPVAVPTSAQTAREAVASWATGRAPAGGDPSEASLLREAYGSGDGTQLALGYATGVLTAPRVDPAVRSAVFDALSKVAGVRVDPDATDPAGRPAAALVSRAARGESRGRFELLIDPDTARVLGTRERFGPRPGANADRPADEPPVSSGRGESVYRYTD